MGRLFAPSKQTSSSQVNLPGWANAGLEQTATRALDLMGRPYQPFQGQRVAGMSDWTAGGADAVGQTAGYQPGQVAAPMVRAPGAVQPRMVQAGQVAPGSVSAERVAPGSLAGRDLSAYYDPYQREVIDAAMSDIDRSTRVAQAGRAAGGVQAAGFGGFGDRAAVAAAEVERAGIDAKARTAAGLRSAGFQRAQDMAVGDINRDFQGQGQNAEMALRAGLANQQTGLGAQQFNVQSGLQAGLANQQAGLAAQQFAAGQRMQASLANQQAGLGAQQFNVSAGLQGAGLRADAGRTLAGLGEVERGVRQAGLDFDYQQFREGRDDPFLKTQWAAGVIGGNANPYMGNVTQTGPGPSPFSQIAGAALTGASIYAMSEPGEKTDKRRIGTDPATGLGIWSYRYKGDSKRYPKVVGPMADEVEERFPHLVHRVADRRVVDMAGLEALRGGLGEASGYAAGGITNEPVGARLLPWLRGLFEGGGDPVDLGDGAGEGWGMWPPAEALYSDPLEVAPRPGRPPRPQREWGRLTNEPVGATLFPSMRRSLPPVIDGVAEPVPVTDAWVGTPTSRNTVGDLGDFNNPPVARGRMDAADVGAFNNPPVARGRMDAADVGAFNAVPPEARPMALPAPVERALARLRAGGGAAPAGAAARAAPDAMPDPAQTGAVAGAMPAAARAAAPAAAAEEPGWFRRFADRLVDPDYAGPQATLQAGLAIMASRNPNWAGALGEGAMAGLQAAERSRPLVRQRRQAREFQDYVRGQPDPMAVSPPLAPRRQGGDPAPERPARMTSVAVPGGAEPPEELRAAFEAASRETGIPVPILVATARQESNFNPAAVGRAGEVGVMQILPSTARDPGFGLAGVDPETLRDPAANILFGARYLRARAGGDADFSRPEVIDRALAAYNGGGDPDYVRNVRRWMPEGAARGAGAPDRAAGAAAPRVVAEQPQGEPTVQIGGRSWTRADLLTMLATMPDNEQAQAFVRNALPMLNQEAARRESAAERAQARAETADLRRELAGTREQPSHLGRLMAERDALPQGDPRRADYDAAIRQASGAGAAERFTPAQMVQLRRDAFAAARGEAGGLEFDSEADRTGWINFRARELLGEWGASEAFEGARAGGAAGGPMVRTGEAGGPARPDAVPDFGARPRARTRDPSTQPLNEGQSKANLFGLMMQQSEAILRGEPLPDGGVARPPVEIPSDVRIMLWRNLPEGLSNWFMDENSQRYFNALRLFAAGVLRKETGAAFAPFELLDVQSRFFPMAGDTAEVIAQKARSRRMVLEAMEAEVPGGFRRGAQTPGRPAAPAAPAAAAGAGAPAPAGGGGQRPPLDAFMR